MRNIQIVVILLFIHYGCEHIISPLDIEGQSITLETPSDASVIDENGVTFSWKKNESIDLYRLQVVTPSFESSKQLVIDTLLDTRIFKDSLAKDKLYEWRVRGENSLYQTAYSKRQFEIRSSENISKEHVVLHAPKDGVLVDSIPIFFTWESIKKAKSYRLQIASPNFVNPNQILRDTLIVASSYSEENIPKNRNYHWRVRAENDVFHSDYATADFQFFPVKDISDETLTLVAPLDSVLVQDKNTSFSWQSMDGATKYRFQMAMPDFNKASQILSDTLLSQLHYSQVLPVEKPLQWRVRAENEIFVSRYATKNLKIIGSQDISAQKVTLIAPYDFAVLKTTGLNLSWNKVDGATKYQLQIARPRFNQPLEIVVDSQTTNVHFRVSLRDKMRYQWRVRAINEHYQTPFSRIQNFDINTAN